MTRISTGSWVLCYNDMTQEQKRRYVLKRLHILWGQYIKEQSVYRRKYFTTELCEQLINYLRRAKDLKR